MKNYALQVPVVSIFVVVVVQSLSHAQFFVIPWTAARQVPYHQLLRFAQIDVH